MKSKRVELAKWQNSEFDDTSDISIDWPSVQRQAGVDHLEWLLKQPREICQLMVEHRNGDANHYLVAEFYDERVLTNYHLMWAK